MSNVINNTRLINAIKNTSIPWVNLKTTHEYPINKAINKIPPNKYEK